MFNTVEGRIILSAIDDASATIKGISDELVDLGETSEDAAERSGDAWDKSAARFMEYAQQAGKGLAAAATAIGGYGLATNKYYRNELMQDVRIQQMLKNRLELHQVTFKQMEASAKDLAGTSAFTAEQIQDAQEAILRIGPRTNQELDRMTQAAADYASATGENIDQAAETIVRATRRVGTAKMALLQVGGQLSQAEELQFEAAGKLGDRYKQVEILTTAMNRATHGMSEAVGEAAGAWPKLRGQMEQWTQSQGKNFDPMVQGLLTRGSQAIEVYNNLTEAQKEYATAWGTAGAGALAGFAAAGPIGAAAGAVGGAVAGAYNLSQSEAYTKALQERYTQTWDDMVKGWTEEGISGAAIFKLFNLELDTGTKKLNEFNQAIPGSKSGGGGGFQHGGPVVAGVPISVGESGREVFVPGQDGRVYPIGASATSGLPFASPTVAGMGLKGRAESEKVIKQTEAFTENLRDSTSELEGFSDIIERITDTIKRSQIAGVPDSGASRPPGTGGGEYLSPFGAPPPVPGGGEGGGVAEAPSRIAGGEAPRPSSLPGAQPPPSLRGMGPPQVAGQPSTGTPTEVPQVAGVPGSYVAGGGTAGGSLGQLISSGEGGYGSFNRGIAGDAGGRTIDFSQMTIGEVMARQSLPRRDPNRLFAVGKYQVIPATMRDAVRSLGIGAGEQFTPAMQERIFREYLVSQKRPAIKSYIAGTGDLPSAQMSLAREFASVASPYTGRSVYGGVGGNAASISAARTARALQAEHEQYQRNIAAGMTPEEAWRKLSPQVAPPTPSPAAVASQSPRRIIEEQRAEQREAQARDVQLGRGRVDVALKLSKDLAVGQPKVSHGSKFDVGLSVDRTGMGSSGDRPGAPDFIHAGL